MMTAHGEPNHSCWSPQIDGNGNHCLIHNFGRLQVACTSDCRHPNILPQTGRVSGTGHTRGLRQKNCHSDLVGRKAENTRHERGLGRRCSSPSRAR